MYVICPYDIQNLLNSTNYIIYYQYRNNMIIPRPHFFTYSNSSTNLEALFLLFLLSFIITLFTCTCCNSKRIKNKENKEQQTLIKAEIV